MTNLHFQTSNTFLSVSQIFNGVLDMSGYFYKQTCSLLLSLWAMYDIKLHGIYAGIGLENYKFYPRTPICFTITKKNWYSDPIKTHKESKHCHFNITLYLSNIQETDPLLYVCLVLLQAVEWAYTLTCRSVRKKMFLDFLSYLADLSKLQFQIAICNSCNITQDSSILSSPLLQTLSQGSSFLSSPLLLTLTQDSSFLSSPLLLPHIRFQFPLFYSPTASVHLCFLELTPNEKSYMEL